MEPAKTKYKAEGALLILELEQYQEILYITQ
jgi:hypothetical protein